MSRCLQSALVICLLAGSASSVGATPILLNFEGLQNLQQIGSFYNGGAGGNYGVTFSKPATALIDQDAGGSGNFAKEPSASTIMYFEQPNLSASMSVAGGFTNSLSFFYTSLSFPAAVTVWGGASGTTKVASAVLPALSGRCGGDPTGNFSCWKQITLTFSGIAQSVAWTGAGNFLGVDNILLNTTGDRSAPVGEPASFVLFGTGATMAAALLRRRRKAMLSA